MGHYDRLSQTENDRCISLTRPSLGLPVLKVEEIADLKDALTSEQNKNNELERNHKLKIEELEKEIADLKDAVSSEQNKHSDVTTDTMKRINGRKYQM